MAIIMDKWCFVLLVFVIRCEAARILIVVPSPSVSHQVAFRDLAKGLASRGHEVVSITTDPAFPKGESPKNLTEIDVHDVTYGVLMKMVPFFNIEDELYDQMVFHYKMFYRVVEEMFKSDEIKTLLEYKDDHFDLLMIESITRSAIVFSHFFKAPVISISSFGMMLETYDASGAASHPLLYPNIFHQKIYNLSIWDKIVQLWKHVKHEYLFSYYEGVQDDMLRGLFGPDIPTIRELTRNIDMFFLNVHPIWSDNQPVPPNVIYLGEMHQRPVKELPKDLQSYMNSSKNGVIYMSLGTNVQPSSLGEDKTNMFMKAFSKLPYNILLKWDAETMPGCPKNVKLVKWVPQSDVLRHPALKLFITQGGLQSTHEAINAGVPLIAFPIQADQFYNSEKYLKHKIGLKLNIFTVTADELENSIKAVINDKSYRENVVRLRSIMADQAQSPLERAIWWTEYVLRHGEAKHLRAPSANMSWFEYYELKLVLIVLSFFVTFIVILYSIFRYIIKNLLRILAGKKVKQS